jgi:hypothetical protein
MIRGTTDRSSWTSLMDPSHTKLPVLKDSLFPFLLFFECLDSKLPKILTLRGVYLKGSHVCHRYYWCHDYEVSLRSKIRMNQKTHTPHRILFLMQEVSVGPQSLHCPYE